LRRAALFVALGRDEGFGLPVAEALASACPVIGFHGGGGRELFGAPFAVAIDDGDVSALADAVELFLGNYDDQREEWERRGREAVTFVRARYSREQATRDLVACFGTIPPRPGIAPTTIVRRALPRPGFVMRVRVRAVRLRRRLASHQGP
jgi:glycosyltransferase involved in cell wall biosynthesis